MEARRRRCIVSLLLSLSLLSFGQSLNMSIQSLDSTIRDYAFKALAQSRTGGLSQVPLPSDLSGIRASAVRLLSASFWGRGANFSSFYFPPRIIPIPYAKRMVVVFEDLGNLSASYHKVPGYSLVAPVVGCSVYDASNATSDGVRELRFDVFGGPILVTFPAVALPDGLNSAIKCARFGPDGSLQLSNYTSSGNTCSTTSTGHFAIVVPSMPPPVPAPAPAPVAAAAHGSGGGRGMVWLIACVGGVVGLVLVGLVGVGIFRLARNKKMEDMESQAAEGEALGTIWIGRSKMPSATMTRTQPAIEAGCPP